MSVGVHESGVRSMETTHRSLLMLRCKVVVVGDSTVGKSALISMFHSGGTTYPKQYVMTAWVDFRVKQVNMPASSTAVELYLFDCAGQSIFNQIEANNVHYENASYLLLVYDVSSQSSFESCGKWLQQVRKGRARGGAMVPGILVANKHDLASCGRRCISKETGQKFAEQNGLEYFETSALEGDYERPFTFIADEFAKKYEETVARAEGN
ncbi:small GTPase superfamily [Pelagophyceae sp. CCMP2097]|nr:small GTPase superfamily [Pelagophyceae sp. CCMP2097]